MTTKSTLAQIVAAFSTLKAADPEVMKSLAGDVAAKAGANMATVLSETQIVIDRWTNGQQQAGITKEQVKTGPQAAASGDGAEKMIQHYSDTTPQHGATLTAESLSRLLGPLASSMKAIGDAHEALTKTVLAQGTALKSILDAVTKADEEDTKDADEEGKEDSEKAKALLKKAKRFVAKSEAADDADDAKLAKAHLKSATTFFGQARGLARLAGNLKLDAQIKSEAAEAGITAAVLAKADDEDDKDEADKSNQDKNVADKSQAAAGGDAAAGAAAPAAAAAGGAATTPITEAQLKSLLDGHAMLTGKINEVFDIMRTGAKLQPAPAFTKAMTPERETSIADIITQKARSGVLSAADAMVAREILSKAKAADEGKLDKSFVEDRLARASAVVQDIFKPAAAA